MTERKLGALSLYLAYTLAFIAGCAIFWLMTQLGVTAFFAPAGLEERGFLLQMLAPLAGLAVFQLLFGLTRRWRGWRFWVFAPLIVYPIVLSYPLLAGQLLSPGLALLIAGGLLYAAGIIVLQLAPEVSGN